jgi:hypothetical protein
MSVNQVGLETVLEQVREHYLAAYRRAIARYRKRFERSAAEVLLEVGRDSPLVYRYYRVDLASGATDPPNFTEVNPPAHLEFEPFRCEHAGMSISLSQLVWNGVEFDVEPALVDDSTLQAWALACIDPDERSPQDADGLGGYLHSICEPESDGNRARICVDFGSAPVGCLLELIALLRQAGCRHADIHSRSMLAAKEV